LIVAKFEQPLKEVAPIEVNELGSVTEVNAVLF